MFILDISIASFVCILSTLNKLQINKIKNNKVKIFVGKK